jgi:hypothetical protein
MSESTSLSSRKRPRSFTYETTTVVAAAASPGSLFAMFGCASESTSIPAPVTSTAATSNADTLHQSNTPTPKKDKNSINKEQE